MKKISVKCPCCSAVLTIDAETGLVLKSESVKRDYSFAEALQKEEEKSSKADELFEKAMKAEEKRAGELEEKFKSIVESKDDLDDPPPRPIELD